MYYVHCAWLVGQEVKTLPSHGRITGSIPIRATIGTIPTHHRSFWLRTGWCFFYNTMPDTENKIFYNKLITFAFPIALQSLMLAMVAACDALMLGQVEQNEMTAVSLATQIQFV